MFGQEGQKLPVRPSKNQLEANPDKTCKLKTAPIINSQISLELDGGSELIINSVNKMDLGRRRTEEAASLTKSDNQLP